MVIYGGNAFCYQKGGSTSQSSIMWSQSGSEFCTPITHALGCGEMGTYQEDSYLESCWETIFRNYYGRILFDFNNDGIQDSRIDSNANGIVDTIEYYVVDPGPPLSAVYDGYDQEYISPAEKYNLGKYIIFTGDI